MSNLYRFEGELEKPALIQENTNGTTIDPILVNGYDGFSGAHDNLVWLLKNQQIAYTMNNKIILEQTKARIQSIILESKVRISCLAATDRCHYLAAGEGEPSA